MVLAPHGYSVIAGQPVRGKSLCSSGLLRRHGRGLCSRRNFTPADRTGVAPAVVCGAHSVGVLAVGQRMSSRSDVVGRRARVRARLCARACGRELWSGVCVCVRAHRCVCAHVCECARTHVDVCARARTLARGRVRGHTNTDSHASVHVSACTGMCARRRTRRRTHTHTPVGAQGRPAARACVCGLCGRRRSRGVCARARVRARTVFVCSVLRHTHSERYGGAARGRDT